MKLEQSKKKFEIACRLNHQISELRREISDMENALNRKLHVRIYYANIVDVECDVELSREIINLCLAERKEALAAAEKEFNALWKQRRGSTQNDIQS